MAFFYRHEERSVCFLAKPGLLWPWHHQKKVVAHCWSRRLEGVSFGTHQPWFCFSAIRRRGKQP